MTKAEPDLGGQGDLNGQEDLNGQGDKAQWTPLSLRRVISHFKAGVTQSPALLPEEVRLLAFLRTVYGGSEATVQLYARYIVGLLNHARAGALDMAREHVDSYLHTFEVRRAKPATCAAIVAALKSFYRHLMADGQTSHNPLALHKKYRTPGKSVLAGHLSHSLSESDMARLLDGLASAGAPQRDRALFALLFMTGLRAEELATLRWQHLILWQDQPFLDVHGKGAKARRVYVPAPALAALTRYRESIPGLGSGAVRPGSFGLHGDYARLPLLGHLRDTRKHLTRHGIYVLIKKWSRALLQRGDVSPHWFRHSCFTQLALKKVPLEAIKALAGHESVETTMRYNEAAALMDSPGKVFE